MPKLPGTARARNLTGYRTPQGRIADEDQGFYDNLSPDEAEFFLKFYEEANLGKPQTTWGQGRKRDAAGDLMIKGERMDADLDTVSPRDVTFSELIRRTWEDQVIREVDNSRFATESDDIEPGIIKKGDHYQCSFFTPKGSLRANFVELDSAQKWLRAVKHEYSKVAW